ncbi:MAG: hypothetical protein JWM21_786 [Acidobacteria bacterium]|nr:hypothetical protein [Acidobacteriota bacterium]
MSNQFRSLDRLRVESSCDADWDQMIGSDTVRFCEHCNLEVNNLSEMTRSKAQRLLARSNGRICVRYVTRPDGGIANTRPPKNLYRISPRVSRLAAGAFTATLSLASAAAQSRSVPEASTLTSITQPKMERSPAGEATATVSGTVKDPAGALVQGATVKLVNSAEHTSFTTTTSETGAYFFAFLSPGAYALTASGGGLAQKEMQNLNLSARDSLALDLNLDLPLIMAEVDILAPEDSTTSVSGGAIFVSAKEPLVKAAAENDLEAIKQLAYSSPNINVRDEHTGLTALEHAVENSNLEITRTLLAAGADVRLKGNRNHTPLMYLGENATPELVRELLTAGARVNERDEDGESVLMKTVSESNLAVVRILTENGARIEEKSNEGRTVLMFAVSNEDPQVAKFLIALGADVNARNDDGETALILAAGGGPETTVRGLIDAGAEVNAKDNRGYTALINAAAVGNLESLRFLLNAGADLSSRNQEQETALSLAVKNEKTAVIELLKSRGAQE